LETNGLGGFASSSIAGLNTRRYHGLLMAALTPPTGRVLLLSKLEETLIIGGRRFELSANRYPGVVHPQGYRYLKEFRLDPFPIFTWEVEGVEIEKRVFMVHGENATAVAYALHGVCSDCSLEIRPLIAFRDFHATTHANNAVNTHVGLEAGLASVTPYAAMPALHFAHDAVSVEPAGAWYYDFEFDRERDRGLDFHEDLFNPFVLKYDLGRRPTASLIASLFPRKADGLPGLERAEIARRAMLAENAPAGDPMVRQLVIAADQFIVQRGSFNSVIAGYHWFNDWGRDAMISLPGLTLVTARPDIARNILLAFAAEMDRGVIPNCFSDQGAAPLYNAIDASLWFFAAVHAYIRYTGDFTFVRQQLYASLAGIVDSYEHGTHYGIRVDSDGLVTGGESGVQLTWMDAKVGDWVVTPRSGKPVEVQALWCNALRVLEELAHEFNDQPRSERCRKLAEAARSSFVPLFWNERTGCLFDVVNESGRDGSIRPNQVMAVSLPHAMLPPDKERGVVQVIERELLTPFGLRSLAPGDPQYRPRYEGDQRSRDSAYHQGTVWPWLLGPFITAYLKVNGRTAAARSQAAKWLAAFPEHLHTAGLGQISEIFDGGDPQRPLGCIAQAWSVAEILRALVEDVLNHQPELHAPKKGTLPSANAS